MTSFWQRCIYKIGDKIATGIIIVLGGAVAGYVFNYMLEEKRAQEAFLYEIAKVRVEKIGQLWSSLYELEVMIDQMEQSLLKFQTTSRKSRKQEVAEREVGSARKKVQSILEAIKKKLDELESTRGRVRFWTGENIDGHWGKYIRLQGERMWLFLEKLKILDVAEIDNAKLNEINAKYTRKLEEIEGAKKNILDIIEELQ